MSQLLDEPIVRSASDALLLLPQERTDESNAADSDGNCSSVNNNTRSSRSSSRERDSSGSSIVSDYTVSRRRVKTNFIRTAVLSLRRLHRRLSRRFWLVRQDSDGQRREPCNSNNAESSGRRSSKFNKSNARPTRHRKNREDRSGRLQLKALRTMLRSPTAVSSNIVSRAAEAAALEGGDDVSLTSGPSVWHGVFNSLSPTDTGGVFCSLMCTLILALCLLFCTVTSQHSLGGSVLEFLMWCIVQTMSSLILNYASFLCAICLMALLQWRKARARQERRLQLRLQREWMRHVREVCEEKQRRGQMEPFQLDQRLYQQKQSSQSQQQQQPAGTSQNNTLDCYDNNVSNERTETMRRCSAEALGLLSELERLEDVELRLQLTDSELVELAAMSPEKIGSAWLSSGCRASLFRAPDQEDTAYARLRLL